MRIGLEVRWAYQKGLPFVFGGLLWRAAKANDNPILRPQFGDIAVIRRTMSDDCVNMDLAQQNRCLETVPGASGLISLGRPESPVRHSVANLSASLNLTQRVRRRGRSARLTAGRSRRLHFAIGRYRARPASSR